VRRHDTADPRSRSVLRCLNKHSLVPVWRCYRSRRMHKKPQSPSILFIEAAQAYVSVVAEFHGGMVEAAGVEPDIGVENAQLIDSGNA